MLEISTHHSHREKKMDLAEFSKALLITGYLFDHNVLVLTRISKH